MQRGLFVLGMVTIATGLPLACDVWDSNSLDSPLALYRQNRLEEALPLFERAVERNARSPEARAWLAESYRRVGRRDDAATMARTVLDLDPCHSFAHMVLADASRSREGPTDTTWTHLLQSVACDSTDGNPWMSVWAEAMRRDRADLVSRSHRRLVETGFLTEAALSYGRWSLRTLPPKAMLVTNGDMDTLPALAVQEVEGLRRDVVVVERGLLNLTWTLRFLRDHWGVPLPYEDSHLDSLAAFTDVQGNPVSVSDQVFRTWIGELEAGTLHRPFCIAVTVDEDYYSAVKSHLQYAGPFLIWRPTPAGDAPDITAIRASLAGIAGDDFSGPWVSGQDRSPVRRLDTKRLAENVTRMALVYADRLGADGRVMEAGEVVAWAEAFERETEWASALADEISRLKEALRERTP